MYCNWIKYNVETETICLGNGMPILNIHSSIF